MAAGSFSAQVNAWVAETKERALAVRNESVQRVIAVAQEPGPSRARTASAVSSGAGLGKTKQDGSRGVSKRAFGPVQSIGGTGNLPVDTGFLRASLKVTLGGDVPSLQDTPTGGKAVNYNEGQVELVLAGAALGDVITAAYTAKYARRIEYGFNGTDSLGRTYSQSGSRFVALAAQQWNRIVNEVATEAQARSGG